MLAAADDDTGVVETMEWIDASSGNPTNRFVEYKTGGHGSDMFKPHPELPGEIVTWYEATLSGKGKPASTPNGARRDSPTVRLLRMTDEPGGSARVMETLTAAQEKDPKSPILEAGFVNRLGYLVLQDDTKTGVAILELNAERHPTSSNAWDSLGDAYLAGGQREKAREASEKALKLADSDKAEREDRRKLIRDSAQEKLDQLKGTAVGAPGAEPPQPPPTIASTVDRQISGIEKQVVEAAEAMPENEFDFSPESLHIRGAEYKGVRTFALQIKHIAASNNILWSRLTGDQLPDDSKGGNGPAAITTKADILKFLKDSFALGHRAAATLTEQNMLQVPEGSKSSRLHLVTFAVAHAFDHYGQMVEYLRMNGIVPPASRGKSD
jgi:uncharacterized damage-inducible protein DinB